MPCVGLQVQIFTGQGTFLRKFGSNVLKNPRGLAVDRRGNVIVAECKVHNVVVFNQNSGSILHQFSLIGAVEFPNGVAVNQDCTRIYITDNHKHCVKVEISSHFCFFYYWSIIYIHRTELRTLCEWML